MEIMIKELKISDQLKLNIKLNSKQIMGIIGYNYKKVIDKLIKGNYDCYINDKKENFKLSKIIAYISKELDFKTNYVIDELKLVLNTNKYINEDINERVKKVLEYLNIQDLMDYKISMLSNSQKRLLQIAKNIISNPKIIILDEPFLFLDYEKKLEIIHIIKDLCHNYNKIIIIASDDSNIIYELTNMTLLITENDYMYDETKNIFVKNEFQCYNIKQPDLVSFSKTAMNKGKNINYYQDIRDLMKEVYRNV